MRNIFFLLLFLLVGCNSTTTSSTPTCDEINKNKILINSPWESKEYFFEMVDLLYRKKDVRYIYDGKILKSGSTFFIVKCIGDDFCGRISLYLGEGDKNSELLNDDEKYKGAELFGLQWHLEDLKLNTYFIYDSVSEIRK